jgi:FeS assembly SUF system protein
MSEEGIVSDETRSKEEIENDVVAALKTVFDPEIPVNIYELGLIYNVDVRDDRSVEVRLTLTSPMCPVAGSLPPEVEAKVAEVDGVTASTVDLVWDPPWEPSMMSEAAKLELGMM